MWIWKKSSSCEGALIVSTGADTSFSVNEKFHHLWFWVGDGRSISASRICFMQNSLYQYFQTKLCVSSLSMNPKWGKCFFGGIINCKSLLHWNKDAPKKKLLRCGAFKQSCKRLNIKNDQHYGKILTTWLMQKAFWQNRTQQNDDL